MGARRVGEIIFGGDRQVVGFDKVPDPSGIEVNHDHAAEVLAIPSGGTHHTDMGRIDAFPAWTARRSLGKFLSALISTSSAAWHPRDLGVDRWRGS